MAWDPAAEVRRMDQLERDERAFQVDDRALVRYYDKFMQEVGEEGRYLSLEFTYAKNKAGGLKMRCPRDMVHFDHIFRNPDGEDATIPITVNTRAFRWDGYITRAALLRDENGVETIDIEAIHCWNHVSTIALWPNPFAPILAQWPRHMILFAPIRSLIAIYLACNLIRLQAPLWQLPDRWMDAPDWAQVGNTLWPIALVPVWIPTDTSVWRAANVRMDMADQVFEPLLDDTGVMLTARFFLPGEDEQPAPDWYYLDRPTVVLETVDKSGSVGPTGTLLDGLINFFEEWVDDTTPVRYPNFSAQSEYEAVYGNPGVFGTFNNLPWVWYLEGEYSGIGASEVAIHKPTATDVIIGGKSPGWVNAGIEFAMKNMLAWLGLLIGLPGLDALYRGQLDDVFLAFNVVRDMGRVERAGPFAPREIYITGSDKAFTLDGIMAARQGLHQTRGYTSKKVSIGDGSPYTFGKDFTVGDQIGFQVGELLFTDYVTEATFTDDRKTSARWELTIGDGSDEQDSVVKAWGRMGQLAGAVKQLFTDVGADLDLLIF
ncbi:phage tail protein [Nocardia cyriacigeorgica]|uniref:Gp37-like protein n=1 Tax=Nocardia cyriacigeorgica TaxID=135487 RepID=UPI002455285A|nr:phage tail protein [Nocardia cyriacigeorgica]